MGDVEPESLEWLVQRPSGFDSAQGAPDNGPRSFRGMPMAAAVMGAATILLLGVLLVGGLSFLVVRDDLLGDPVARPELATNSPSIDTIASRTLSSATDHEPSNRPPSSLSQAPLLAEQPASTRGRSASASSGQDGLPQEEVNRRVREATALVISPSGKEVTTAFCVDRRGFFVTSSAELVSLGAGYQLAIVLQAGQVGQRTVQASVSRVDADSNLVLLMLADSSALQSLELGDETALVSTDPLTTFGFAARAASNVRRGQYPAIDIVQSAVTSLRNSNNKLEAIQVDGRLIPGNAGGPAINAHGQVVGIVQGGIVGADLNFLVPVGKLKKLLEPEIQHQPPALTQTNIHQPIIFEARATSFTEPESPLELELQLTPDNDSTRTHTMELTDGVYRSTVVLVAHHERSNFAEPSSIESVIVAKQGGREVGRVVNRLKIAPAGTRITATSLARAEVTVPLAAEVADIAVGGAGRWLILHLPDAGQLAVFDVSVGEVVHQIPVTDEGLHFAASMEKLVVVSPESREIQRWDLPTLQLEQTVPIPVAGTVRNISMGSGSQGPLLVRTARDKTAADWTLIDLGTLESLSTIASSPTNAWLPGNWARDDLCLRPSGNGHVFGIWMPIVSSPTLNALALEPKPAKLHRLRLAATYMVPSPDGKRIYTSVGIVNEKGESLENVPRGRYFLPAHHGDYFLGRSRELANLPGGTQGEGTALFIAGDAQPIACLPSLNYHVAADLNRWTLAPLTLDKRIHLLPDAGLIITLPEEKDRLVLHRLDIERAMDVSQPTPARVAQDRALDPVEDSVALVVLPSGKGFGSSFCVHEGGYFVTNAHVISNVQAKVTLVLQSGEPNERLVEASVVRYDRSTDLALLKTDTPTNVAALKLSDEETLAEGILMKAYGYPFGDALAVTGQKFPNVSVNVGPVVGLNKKVGGRESIEFEAQVNPGNSGGPLLNAKNEVVGVVWATKIGQGESFAIPLGSLNKFLEQPEILFSPPTLTQPSLREPTAFEAQAIRFVPSGQPLEIELTLDRSDGIEQRHTLSSAGDRFSAGVASETDGDSILIKISLEFETGSITGFIGDRKVTIGGQAFNLSQLQSLHFSDDPHAISSDRERINGTIGGLDRVPVRVGKMTAIVNCSDAIKATVKPYDPWWLTYSLVARFGDKEITRLTGLFDTDDSLGFGTGKGIK